MNITSRSLTAALIALGCLGAVNPAAAQGAATPMKACQPDLRKWCADIRPGGGKMAACLQQHASELSPECQAQLPVLQRCGQELKSLCGEGKPAALRQCLRDKHDALSAECRELVPAR